jgi:hypothetical protein
MARVIPTPDAVEAARSRRAASAQASSVRIEWFIRETCNKIALPMQKRVAIATEYLKSKVIQNISVAVLKGESATGTVRVIQRSKPGEFPRADTTQLMKTIFSQVIETSAGVFDGYVGTPLDYGLILETTESLKRSFLMRTLNEEQDRIRGILTGPIK